MPNLQFFNVANTSFKAIRENNIIAKIVEFTVFTIFGPIVGEFLYKIGQDKKTLSLEL